MKPKLAPAGAPWTASESGAAITGVMRSKTDAGNTYTYEVIVARTMTPFFNHRSAKERQEAARLIAAAPELFAALVEVVAISDRKHEAWDRAKAAIAKATGEQS